MVILVKDHEEAVAFYTKKLGFEVYADIHAGQRRHVHVCFPNQPEVGIWLMKAESADQADRIGRQTPGQPCAVLYSESLGHDYGELVSRGVEFTRGPKEEAGVRFAHFVDLYGNEFVLVELEEG